MLNYIVTQSVMQWVTGKSKKINDMKKFIERVSTKANKQDNYLKTKTNYSSEIDLPPQGAANCKSQETVMILLGFLS